MGIIDKDIIERWILLHLSKWNRGFNTKARIYQIVRVIFYQLKTGCQWRDLPIKQFINEWIMSFGEVYHNFRKWSNDGSWKGVWVELLR